MTTIEDAKKLLVKANDHSKPKLLSFRFNADWDSTARYARDAATILMRDRSNSDTVYDLTVEALELSAVASDKINVPNQAARDYEALAKLHRTKGKFQKSYDAFEKASRFYRLNNQVDQAASMLVQGAKVAEEQKDDDACMRLLNAAVAIYEDEEEKAVTSESTFKAAINYLVKQERWIEARKMIVRQNNVYRRKLDMYAHEIHFNYLSYVILLIREDKVNEAGPYLESITHADRFDQSNAYECARALVATLETEPERLDEVRQRFQPALTSIDASVSRVIYRLNGAELSSAGRKRGKRDEAKNDATRFDAAIDAALGESPKHTEATEASTGAVEGEPTDTTENLAESHDEAVSNLL